MRLSVNILEKIKYKKNWAKTGVLKEVNQGAILLFIYIITYYGVKRGGNQVT